MINTELLWHQDFKRLSTSQPECIQQWMSDPASLTQKLKTRFKDFAIHIICQKLRLLNENESNQFSLIHKPAPDTNLFFIRETVLSCEQANLIYAKILIPQAIYHYFKHLNQTSIGEVLFEQMSLVRSNFWYGEIALKNLEHQHIAQDTQTNSLLPCRFSYFMLDNFPLLITEIFTPALIQKIKET